MLAVISLAGIAWAAWIGFSTEGFPIDDAWIHLVYARNLIEHGVFGYNPAEWENGSTAPLWVFIIALFQWAGLGAVTAAKVAGVLGLALLAAGGYRLCTGLAGWKAGALAAFLLAWDPWLGVLSVFGMEPVAAMAAVVWAIACLQERHWWRAGMLMMCAALLRPELGIFGVLAIPVVVHQVSPGQRRAALLRLLLPPAAAAALWILYGLVVTGYPLPNTFLLKVVPLQLRATDQWLAFYRIYGSWHPAVSVLGLGFLLAGIRVAWQRSPALSWLLLVAPALLCAFVFSCVFLGDELGQAAHAMPNAYFARYALLLRASFLLLMALGLWQILEWARVVSQAALRIFLAAACLAMLLPWQFFRPEINGYYSTHCQEINHFQGRMAEWINAHVPDDAVIGVSDAGVLRYKTRVARVIDLVGLNSADVLRERMQGHDLVPLLEARGVSYLAIWPAWHLDLLASRYILLEPQAKFGIRNTIFVATPGYTMEQVIFAVRYPGEQALSPAQHPQRAYHRQDLEQP